MMNFLALLALLGLFLTAALGTVPQDLDLNSFIEAQTAHSMQSVLDNIGPNGTRVTGTDAGLVVASPSRADPNYFYTWTRDSALVLKMLIDEFLLSNTSLLQYVEDYAHSQAVLQTVTNPSGALLPSGKGLGEAKFNVDMSRFNLAWGRPQRDGPALRAVALITYSDWLVDQGETDRARDVIWPIIENDLSYTGQYWNQTGFDLWEEVSGSSFFTIQNQYRALVQGAELASKLGVNCTGCNELPEVSCFLQSFWNGAYYQANLNSHDGRSGRDASTILGPVSVFDVNAHCDDPSLQPCSSRSLATFKVLVDAFRDESLYPINTGIPNNVGVAVGRYPEDVYYDGNPWFLITLVAAEFLYDAVARWEKQGYIVVDPTSLPFFRDIVYSTSAKLYRSGPQDSSGKRDEGDDDVSPDGITFDVIVEKVLEYADSFVAVVQRWTPEDWSMAEQYDKVDGTPLSATDLTWSYANFVAMSRARSGRNPPSWVPDTFAWSPAPASDPAAAPAQPQQCAGGSTPGVYAPALAAGAPNVTASCVVPVTFAVNASTYYGENIFVVGDAPELGSWDLANATPLGAANYTDERALWFAEIDIEAGESVSYVYVRQEDCDQGWLYETTNRTLTVPACSSPTTILTDDAWIGPVGTSSGCVIE